MNHAPQSTIPLSILDLVGVPSGGTVTGALRSAMDAVKLADELGFQRYWFAEHHNSDTFASSATSLLIGHAAALTKRIRVGAGGVMLPNHSPLVVAEQFGTLARLHGDRIDLGLGRAPGTDPITARALRRTDSGAQSFADEIFDLQGYFSATGQARRAPIKAITSAGTRVPLWVLGSSTAGASIAGQLGLPLAVASHFAPVQLIEAIAVYREHFNPAAPTASIDAPYVMAGVNVMVADSDDEARFRFSTVEQMFLNINRGVRGQIATPHHNLEAIASAQEIAAVRSTISVSAVGTPRTVRTQLERFVESTGVDEVLVVTYSHDPAVRLHSLRLLARAWQLPSASRVTARNRLAAAGWGRARAGRCG